MEKEKILKGVELLEQIENLEADLKWAKWMVSDKIVARSMCVSFLGGELNIGEHHFKKYAQLFLSDIEADLLFVKTELNKL